MSDPALWAAPVTKVALNPLQWYLTIEGPRFEQAPPLAEIYRQIRAAGFGAVHIEPPDSMTLEEYGRLLADSGLRAAPGYFQAPFSRPEELAEVLERAKRFAGTHARLGLDRLFIADQFADPARLEAPGQGVGEDSVRLGLLIEGLGAACEAMVGEGVVPCLHQHVGTLIETPDETERVLTAIDPSLLLLGADTGHLAWAGADPAAFIRRHADRVGAVHLKDLHMAAAEAGRNLGESYGQISGRHLWTEPGRGDVHFDEVLRALASFEGWFVIEVDIPDQPTPFESAQVSWRWVERHLSGRG